MKKGYRVGTLAGLVMLLAASPSRAQDPKEKILGRWETKAKVAGQEVNVTLEFARGGRMTMLVEGLPSQAAYRWVDNDHVEITVDPGTAQAQTQKARVRVTDKELTLTGISKGFSRGRDTAGKCTTRQLVGSLAGRRRRFESAREASPRANR